MRMHWILRGAAKQEAQHSPATYSREDSTFGCLPAVCSVHISCNVVVILFVILEISEIESLWRYQADY